MLHPVFELSLIFSPLFPAGGNSLTTYTQVTSHLYITDSSLSSGYGSKTSLSAGAGAHGETSLCAGLGVMACQTLVGIDVEISASHDQEESSEASNDLSSSHGVSVTYTMSTSDQPGNPGRSSDMYLVPSLVVVFEKAFQVAFDATTCTASRKPVVTWSLDSQDNVQVCSIALYVHRLSVLSHFLLCCC